jgi:hypothetical protein
MQNSSIRLLSTAGYKGHILPCHYSLQLTSVMRPWLRYNLQSIACNGCRVTKHVQQVA